MSRDISAEKSIPIHIKGARTHNLKNLEVSIPRSSMVVITGVSGSGKSSLAFDTLYAEGYRKYIDSLSTHARQLLDQLPRPDVDFIHGLSPVVAVKQDPGRTHNPRATVGTTSEIADYARLLWSLAAEPRCPVDGGLIVQRSVDDWVDALLDSVGSREAKAVLLAPWMEAKVSVIRGELETLKQRGWERLRVNGEIKRMDDVDVLPKSREAVVVDVVIDRVVLRADQRSRLADSLELAFREGAKRAMILIEDPESPTGWSESRLSQDVGCAECGRTYSALSPRSFSWNHIEGACPTCGGVGQTMQFAAELLVPDPSKSVKSGAIKPWRLGSKRMIIQRNATLKQLAEQYPFDPTVPWEDLDPEVRDAIVFGTGERQFLFKLRRGKAKPETTTFDGVIADLENTRRTTSSEGLKARLMAYQVSSVCKDCQGRRLNAVSRAATLDGTAFDQFMSMPLERAHQWIVASRARLGAAEPGSGVRGKLGEVFEGLESRLRFLVEVGLGYLSLDRSFGSLSGGEAQRVHLATQLGMGLVGVGYVLDEPTIGLHPHDTRRLIDKLHELRDRGNAVIVVEHDDEVIRAADHLIEIGPGAGGDGGELIFQGTPAEAGEDRRSRTGPYLSGRRKLEKSVAGRMPGKEWLEIKGAREHNLKSVDARFPIGLLTCVTGVSGSGKSTLVNGILGKAAAFKLNRAKEIPGLHDRVEGLDYFERTVRVDQEPIGRSPRSNPATFTKIFDELRKVFALTPLAKVRGYSPGRFSFNVRGGRCERCQGDGQIKLDMQFLSDVYAECPSCHGSRYNRETLEVRYRGLNIAEILDLTVDQAAEVFSRHPKMRPKLETLRAVGLGYIRLGQASNTVSGGEAQRLKLSLELGKRSAVKTLYLLDEPTTGLHWIDIQKLLDLLFQLRDAGHTVIVIEHNPDLVRLSDWVIDMGPGGGDAGGEIVFAGTPLDLEKCEKSLTGRCLKSDRMVGAQGD